MAALFAFAAKILPLVKAVGGAVGIAAGVKSLTQKSSALAGQPAPTPQPLPTPPTVEDAQKSAGIDVAKRRRISVLSGGVTNVTRGKALVSEENIGTKSLLGS